MSRNLRITFPDVIYHVGARGYEKSFIFREDKEKQHFLDILKAASKHYGFLIHDSKQGLSYPQKNPEKILKKHLTKTDKFCIFMTRKDRI